MGVINYCKVLHKNLQDLTEPKKTYALAQSRGRMDVDALAAHMSSHNTPFSKGTIKAVLDDFVVCTRELILDGWILDLGNMGTFNVALKSKGVCESVVDPDTGVKPVFSTSYIKEVNCLYTPGPAFENMISDVTFHEVPTRKAQRDALQEKHDDYADGTYKSDEKRAKEAATTPQPQG